MAAGPALLVRAGVLLVLVVAAIGTPADADLWGHVLFGRDIVSSRQIAHAEPYSFTSDRAWINHEWLAEVVFFVAYRAGGGPGLIAVKVAIVALLLGVVAWRLRRCGANLDVTGAALVITFVGTYWRTHSVRPQIFSVLLFACLLVLLAEVDAGRRRLLWMVAPLFAVWVNLHGGWIVGLGALGIWSASALVGRDVATRWKAERVGVGVLAAIATLANPYGVQMWTFLAETVGFGRPDIQDWAPVHAYPLLLGIPWMLTFIAGVLAFRASGSVPLAWLAAIGVLALASLRVGRLDAFFTVSVVVLLAPGLVAALTRWRALRALHGSDARQPPKTRSPAQAWAAGAIFAAAVGAMLVPAAPLLWRHATCVVMDDSALPEPEVVRFVEANRLRGRMLTFFDWGQYAIWHFAPHLQVSMDGRRETVYSEDLIDAHWRFYAGEPGFDDFLQALDPDYIWLPRDRPIVGRLPEQGWSAVFSGPVSMIFARNAAISAAAADASPVARRCFPGP